ncbi:type I restriction endonuclease subunit R [Micromonospora sp. C41]|uniref:type I restriction endonuclease subunit R n=1 Tax=Micromonospora sp. C41 TaxID=2824878 RepID=UPI001B35F599|nr:type I restriction endonuclease [Micromonospora sp. C41]MBQ1062639.1 type I restriction endonuclease subunit R [Micromonospora sp. C41]
MPADTSEKGLETILVEGLCAHGWMHGKSADYSPAFGLDLVQLRSFLEDTQPALAGVLDLDPSSPAGLKTLSRIQGAITKRGVIDVLRNGIQHGPHEITLFYGTPSRGNAKSAGLFAKNRFTVTRQLHYSEDETKLALDVGLFINGLPISTFELKNSLTKQTVADAVEQYKRDRDPKELIFGFKRTLAHFAVDDAEVEFCTNLAAKPPWFLPFNRGFNDGAGNPPNPNGLKTAYLWEEILTPASLTKIIEAYAQVIEEVDETTGKKSIKQLFPRFHQLDVVRKLLADAGKYGAGRRYLIQHSTGSGKSNSIAWLAHQLIRVEDPKVEIKPVFDSIIVVTDRRVLDRQIRDTIKQFAQVGATVGHAEHSSDLRDMIEAGKKIIITTVQKFPFILAEIGDKHRERNFAIIIDEAHSSQGGRTASAVSKALAAKKALATKVDDDGSGEGDDDPVQDLINEAMEARRMLPNASYFAFTATPKNKTLEMFGDAYVEDGKTKHKPFHTYTMKQAIEERFILDVLKCYTPVQSYYRLVKTVAGDPEFDTKRATKKLRAYVEGNQTAIAKKAQIMVDHFLEQVIALQKVGGEARAMIVTGNIMRAIEYFYAIGEYLEKLGSQYKAIVAFSGEHEYAGEMVNEAKLNRFPSADIAERIRREPYRFLVCADKFQTGYDEPLLHSMYVDKKLSGVKAVQTLSRLNRAHPKKHDVFVLDFQNDVETICKSFESFYRTTVLSDETDANKLHDLKATLDGHQVYDQDEIDALVTKYLTEAPRDELDPILDVCVARYNTDLDEDAQVEFKGDAKSFARTYDFLASILPYSNAAWEKLSIFLNFLVPKLPAPKEDDLSKGILEAIDMDSYRVEKQAAVRLLLPDADAEIDPVPASGVGRKPEPELDRLSNILKTFNDLFGNIAWTDEDRIRKLITKDIPEKVNSDPAYQAAKNNSDKQNARIEHDKALEKVILNLIADDTELFKQFMDNPEFKRWLAETTFGITYS